MNNELIEIGCGIIFDSWVDSVPELRSDNLDERHLIYEGGGIILDLLLKGDDDGASLHVGGQVLPREQTLNDVADLTVSLRQGEQRTFTQTNALGEFTFEAVSGGKFDLAITFRDRSLTVSGLSNREPRRWRVVASAAAGGD